MAELVADGDRQRPAPRRAGRHGHRQDARLPRPGDRVGRSASSSPPPPRRCRTSSPPRTCRSSPTALPVDVRLGGAQGPQQLRLPAAAPRGARRRRRAGPARARGAWRRRSLAEIARLAEWVGARRRPATSPSSTGRPSRRGVAGGQRRQRRVPGRRPLPAGRAVLRRAGPAPGRGRRRRRRQHPPLRPRTSAAAA